MKNTYFCMDDTGKLSGVVKIDYSKAIEMNNKNFGIFWVLNEFKDDIRKTDNLIKILNWNIDIDKGSKNDQMNRILKSPLKPSMLIETKNGYHVYWFSKDATPENYKAIVASRLVPFFGADIRAKDFCRILRVPSFYHCKNPQDKFLVKETWLENLFYSEDEMLKFFKPEHEKQKIFYKGQNVASNGFWDKIVSIPVDYALEKLSGSKYVQRETFKLRNNRNNTKQILVNGRSTSSWIDIDGNIGSYDRGGTTIIQWLNWYLQDYRETANVLKEVFKKELL